MAVLLNRLGGLTYVVWGLFVRVAVTANVLACFDYVCHSQNGAGSGFVLSVPPMMGETIVWLVGVLTSGEGWHNNHHAIPTSPRMGVGRFFGYVLIRAALTGLQVSGLPPFSEAPVMRDRVGFDPDVELLLRNDFLEFSVLVLKLSGLLA